MLARAALTAFAVCLACTDGRQPGAKDVPVQEAPAAELAPPTAPGPSMGDGPGAKLLMSGCVEVWMPSPPRRGSGMESGTAYEGFASTFEGGSVFAAQVESKTWLGRQQASLSTVYSLLPSIAQAMGAQLLDTRLVQVGDYQGVEMNLRVPVDGEAELQPAIARLFAVGQDWLVVGATPTPSDWARVAEGIRMAPDCDPNARP